MVGNGEEEEEEERQRRAGITCTAARRQLNARTEAKAQKGEEWMVRGEGEVEAQMDKNMTAH